MHRTRLKPPPEPVSHDATPGSSARKTTTQPLTMKIICQNCDSESVIDSYKDDPAQRCSTCDRILARGV